MYQCPACEITTGITTERRPNGYSTCSACGFVGPTNNFTVQSKPTPIKNPSIFTNIRLVEETLGAQYSDKFLFFKTANISHYVVDSKSYESYPKCIYIFMEGFSLGYRVRREDFEKVVGKL